MWDRHLMDSLAQWTPCEATDSSRHAASRGGGLKGAEPARATGARGSGTDDDATAESSQMSGERTADASRDPEGSETVSRPEDRVSEKKTREVSEVVMATNGAAMEDIPLTSQDIFAEKVRKLAEAETDPVKKDRLWQKYRELQGRQTTPSSDK